MPLDALAGLITAVFELKAVQAVTRAINANLPKDGPLGTIRPSSAQLYARPRRYYSPTPEARVLPRRVEQPSPNFARGRDWYDRAPRDDCPSAGRPVTLWTMDGPDRPTPRGAFDAPWKHLPPVAADGAPVKVNLIRPKVDVRVKGALVDFYA